jgi:formylglycine-generating enzyme required for sulfatase activity
MKRMIDIVVILLVVYFVAGVQAADNMKKEGTKSAVAKGLKDAVSGMEFVSVKGGCFQMGDNSVDNTYPVHEVCVNDFSIGKYEVTQGQWVKIMGKNPSENKACGDNCPVENVSWDMAQEFIGKLNKLSNKKYRMPTEAEWEYACRSGGKNEKYCGGDDIDPIAWYYENSGNVTHPVGQKLPNGLGIYDMGGNVWEWVNDWYGQIFYWFSPKDNPVGPSSSWSYLNGDKPVRVIRGGGYSDPILILASHRGASDPKLGDAKGFRLVMASGLPNDARIPGKPGTAQGVNPLPAGGGEPGNAYIANLKAETEEINEAFGKMEKRAFLKKYYGYIFGFYDKEPTDEQIKVKFDEIKQYFPKTVNARVLGGISKGDMAIVHAKKTEKEGESEEIAYMMRKNGKWTFVNRMTRSHFEGSFEVTVNAAVTLEGGGKTDESPFGPINMAASRVQYMGDRCPIETTYIGTINFKLPLPENFAFTYHWERSDGGKTSEKVVRPTGKERAMLVKEKWKLGVPGLQYDASMKLFIDSGDTHIIKETPTVKVICK